MFGNRAKTATNGQEGRYCVMGRITNNTTVNFTRDTRAARQTLNYIKDGHYRLTDPSSLVQSGLSC